MKIVISCQQCIRQYEVDSDTHGKLARCDACKAYFTIQVAEPAHPGDAINLTNIIEPNYLYFHEAAACFVRNLRLAFDQAGEPMTAGAALRFVETLPRYDYEMREEQWQRSYCSHLMIRAIYRGRGRWDDVARRRVNDYFLWLFPDKSHAARMMLINAFTGFLSVEFDKLPGKELAVVRKRGWLERFAGRKGL